MARARCRQTITDAAGNRILNASVYVYQPGTTTPIVETMYSGASGAGTAANPLTTDVNGAVEFYLAAPRVVDLKASRAGFVDLVLQNVQVAADATDSLPAMLTTKGDVPYASAANVAARLPIGNTNDELTVVAGVPAWVARTSKTVPMARVYHNAAQSIASDLVGTVLAFNQERYDTDTIHDTVTNNGRLTCKTAGKYRISAQVSFAAAANGIREVILTVGATVIAVASAPPTSASNSTVITVSTVYALGANDYVTCTALQNSGGAINVEVAGNHSPEFMMEFVGA